MTIRLDIYHHFISDAHRDAALTRIESLLNQVLRKETAMAASLDDVIAAVAAETDVIKSAEVLMDQLSAQLAAAGTDPAKIQAVIDSINASKADLAASVAKNTPAAPTPPTP